MVRKCIRTLKSAHYMYLHAYIPYMYLHVCIRTCIRTFKSAHYMYLHAYVPYMYLHTYVHMQTQYVVSSLLAHLHIRKYVRVCDGVEIHYHVYNYSRYWLVLEHKTRDR